MRYAIEDEMKVILGPRGTRVLWRKKVRAQKNANSLFHLAFPAFWDLRVGLLNFFSPRFVTSKLVSG